MKSYDSLGFGPADILIPVDTVDHTKWSVVACDQYTSEPQYWSNVDLVVGTQPSTLRIILPEIYLDEGKLDGQIESISRHMQEYLDAGLLRTLENSFIYVERTLRSGKIRRGLVGAVDLEKYDFDPEKKNLVRATEGTVVDRLPPRVRIRRGAPLEVPHAMLLMDDVADGVLGPLRENKDLFEKVYDFPLMQDAGRLKGYCIPAAQAEGIRRALEAMLDPDLQAEKYGEASVHPLLFAVGDGNHSLAAAKKCWEAVRENLSPEEAASHPARYALCELVNVHDESLAFEPIHRVVFGCSPQKLLAAVKVYFPESFEGRGDGQRIGYVTEETEGVITIPNAPSELVVGTLQRFLDDYAKAKPIRIDYIHGEDVVRALARQEDTVGFLLPSMGKSELFTSIVNHGVLPRKTFSMGEACDKRFYLECRKIVR